MLNIIRENIETDKESGKNTLAVQYGSGFAKSYHLILIVAFTLLYMMMAPSHGTDEDKENYSN